MSTQLDIIKSHSKELVKIVEDIENKAEQQSLTKQEFLEFLKKVKEKNSLVIEEIDTLIDTGGFNPRLF
ncbi:MAG: hypothetical protein IJV86_01920 [Clostridia bacterium]|nr:hypothetical protein [Clostridia bacterium]